MSSLLQRILADRNSDNEIEFNRELSNLKAPYKLANVQQAATVIADLYTNQDKIIVVGDYDVDGACATVVCISILKALGFSNVEYIIPNRFTEGYGLSGNIATKILSKKPALVITVDNGIASVDAVAQLRQNNISVIITDHHLPPAKLPNANAIVNPNLENCQANLGNLSGTAVIFYLMIALRKLLIQQKLVVASSATNLLNYCDLVALATIADMVNLDKNNRLLCYQGLKVIRSAKGNNPLKLLIAKQVANIKYLNCEDLAFYVAPVFNSVGRLDDMRLVVEFLLATDATDIEQNIIKLLQINTNRKQIQKDSIEAVQSQVDVSQKILTIYSSNCHIGVTGLVASSLVKKYNKPAIVCCLDDDNNQYLKCSARSVAAIDIKAVLDTVNKQNTELLVSYGGHKMVAGLTVATTNFADFNRQVQSCIADDLGGTDDTNFENAVQITAVDLTLENAIALRTMVWGNGFEKPIFKAEFTVLKQTILAEKYLKFDLELANKQFSGICFNVETQQLQQQYTRIEATFFLEVNFFKGENLQLQITNFDETS